MPNTKVPKSFEEYLLTADVDLTADDFYPEDLPFFEIIEWEK